MTMALKATAFGSVLCLAVIAIAANASNHDIVTSTPASINGASNASDNDIGASCVYSVYVRTGTIIKAGTDSNISLVLGNAEGSKFKIRDLVSWGGLMGQNYDYFEFGNLDIFSGRGPCLKGSVCTMELISDGTGAFAGWYCSYVDVTSTGPNSSCNKLRFPVNTWLQPPSPLTFSANRCKYYNYNNANLVHAAIATVLE